MNSEQIIQTAAEMLESGDFWYDHALAMHVDLILAGPYPLHNWEIKDLAFAIQNAKESQQPARVTGAKTW